MKKEDISLWKHHHDFAGDFLGAEKSTRRVLVLTVIMMVVEIFGGMKLHSMALLADGWHMATHVAAFFITVMAYRLARRHARNEAFSFGTGKIGVLGAYTSAIILGGIACYMVFESVQRFFHPEPIHFNEAILVACIGLAVNVVSALMLKDPHRHTHGGHSHPHQDDLNLKAAYIHVIADAVTSVLAIIALVGGKFLGWVWLDPVMGLVGSVVILRWASTLMRDTFEILLDQHPASSDLDAEIRKAIEGDGTAVIADLHIWQIGVNKFAAIIALVTRNPLSPTEYKQRLSGHEELVHITVEVHSP